MHYGTRKLAVIHDEWFANDMISDRFLSAWFFSASGRVSASYCLFLRHACQSDKTDLFSSLQACALIHNKQTKKETKLKFTKLFTSVLIKFSLKLFSISLHFALHASDVLYLCSVTS